ncbi:MAG: TonB-dependent receptor [Acidobacteria bacterium]|nr:TonB-dependent receptor [Acidobacteriota bacterium]
MNKAMHRAALLALVALLVTLCQVRGQVTLGTLSGVVKDASGAVLPGVTLKARHLDTGIVRTTISDDAGRYHLPQLALGGYELEAELAGFQTVVRSGVTLTVGRELEVNFALPVGEITERVQVSAEAPLVETTTAAISGLVDEKAIRDLPLNGRQFDQLIGLQAGSYSFRLGSNPGSSFSISGGRTGSNRILMDGTEIVDGTSTGGGIGGVTLGVESIREFSVLTNSFSAELGKRPGGVVNVATRSGTNQLHGSVFEFLRNDDLDARNFFDPPGPLPEFKRNNFGFAVGGPMVRDRTFFFGNYEGIRQGLGRTFIHVTPDDKARQGLLPDPSTAGLRLVPVADVVKPYLALYPLPNGRSNGDGTAELITSPTSASDTDFYLVKTDHRFSEADSLFATYRLNKTRSSAVGTDVYFPNFGSSGKTRNQFFNVQENRLFSTRMLNTLRLGVNRSHSISRSFPLVNIDPRLSFVEGLGFGAIRVGGGTGRGSAALNDLGDVGGGTVEFADIDVQFSDQLAHTSGPHSVKVGFEVQRMHHNIQSGGGTSPPLGQYSFNSLEDFLAGRPASFRVLTGDQSKGMRLTYAGFYIQDDLKLRPDFTLNLGLRYEFTTGLREVNGKLSNFVDTVAGGYRVFQTQPRSGGELFNENNSLKGFAPRMGLAWNVSGDGKTSLRSGFGIFYNQFQAVSIGAASFLFTNVPFTNLYSIDNPAFPRVDLSGRTTLTPSPDGIDPNWDVPTSFHYNLMIQREVFPHMTVSVGYVGSRGYHLSKQVQGNAAIPQIQSDGRKFFPVGAARRNPRLSNGRYLAASATYHYDSLQLSLERSYSGGLRLKGAYTWSKSIDNASTLVGNSARNNPQVQLDPDDIRPDRSLSAFDARHNFVFNCTYDLPLGGAGGAGNQVLAGWQFNGIASLASGAPFTPKLGFNRSRNLDTVIPDRPNLRPGADKSPVLGGPDRYFDTAVYELQPAGFFGNAGRNTIIGPGFVNFDFALVKATPLPRVSEDFAVQFRAELFNALNRANFFIPDALVFNSNGTPRPAGARIRATTNTARQIQFGLKIVF